MLKYLRSFFLYYCIRVLWFSVHFKTYTMHKVLLLVIVGIAVSEALECYKGICDIVRCRQVTKRDCKKKGEVFIRNGGFCGCCNACRAIIKEGGSCLLEEEKGAPPPVQCEKGTTYFDTRFYRKMYKILLLVLVSIAVADAAVCRKDTCSTVRCKAAECKKDEIFVEKGGYCGCCDACRKIIKEGESCPLELRGVPPTSQCEEGTTCMEVDNKRICVSDCD
ncbi:uncharacterized protein NPIL_672711 [Nephila pilipes]|uniref:Uncharacterized protein n=1 Tax=Nephila pilipes TaxID=299642 RepID=A0A8X6TC39_NEPPI|nr:uncharacterized protein NPIL_672711 [Nephila pilipes]